MPPKAKSKCKKGAHPSPQDHPTVIRNRKQAQKADDKKLKVAARRLKNEQKQKRKAASASNNKEVQDSLQREKSDEENEFEEVIHYPQSSGTKPSVTRTKRQESDQKDSKEGNKNTNPSFHITEPGTSIGKGQQADQQNDSNQVCKENVTDRSSEKETLVKPKNCTHRIPKTEIGRTKQEDRNITRTRQSRSQSILQNLSDKNMHKNDEAKEVKNKKIGKRPTKCKDFASNTPDIVSPKAHSKSAEDLSKKRNILQEEEKANDNDLKSLDEPTPEESGMVINGDLKVWPPDIYAKIHNKQRMTCCTYISDQRKIYLVDRSIRIDMRVSHGSQVVCYSRSRQKIDSSRNAKFCSDTGQKAKAVEIITFENLEKCEKTTSDTNYNSNLGKFSSTNIQTVVDQAIYNPRTDILTNSEKCDETATETKCNTSSISKFSEENSSAISSLQKRLQKVCEDYLKNHRSIVKSFERRVENYIKSKLSNISEK